MSKLGGAGKQKKPSHLEIFTQLNKNKKDKAAAFKKSESDRLSGNNQSKLGSGRKKLKGGAGGAGSPGVAGLDEETTTKPGARTAKLLGS